MMLVAFLIPILAWAFCTMAVPVLLVGAGWRVIARPGADLVVPLASTLVPPVLVYFDPSALGGGSAMAMSGVSILLLCPAAFVAILFLRRRVREELVACNVMAIFGALLAIVSYFTIVAGMGI